MTRTPDPRKGMPSPQLTQAEFRDRYLSAFTDPAFEPLAAELEKIAAVAWDGYANYRKAPRTRKAGPGYADPDYDLSVDWIAAKAAIADAQARHEDRNGPCRILLINASSRSEHTCPGEMSKSYRLAEISREVLAIEEVTVELLDLSRLASEYGRQIHPCKACFSTSPALCHWPCSCYPNHALGQVHDWMNDIYPLWVEAHGVMIITPVNWYQVSSPLKLMMDRLVCADGGNQGRQEGQGDRAGRLELSQAPGRPGVLGDRPRRCGGRGERAPQRLGLAEVHGPGAGRGKRRARPLYRLLAALRDQS
ncbi:MAG: flavodoxin family protein [Phenylobacterium sp.]|uniref:flavodoxin family protein n=1 Tax=Phenylobacterium sp. TaxID=1871053 RepID=UPI0027365801|nr:flavodoxin family protein [Phenylobacterium sp.]MDP3748867.1 flavodoxin family protein [Phenylobacterium sp.]